jgi:integrase
LTRAFKARLREKGLDERIRFHDLRHTHLTLGASDAAIPVPVMQRRAGHVRIETTAGYLDPDRAADHLVAEAFDRLFASE